MSKTPVLDLFSGIGGFSLGLERTGGFETVAFCEIDPFCRKVLNKHWPEVPIYHDITRAKFKENVGLVTAGFPCQDISFAGAGAGLTGERSGLFWYILRTLCMVGRPTVLLENVAALLNRGMGSVLGSLASFGYDAEWHCIQASRVGLGHGRDRLFIMANTNGERWPGVLYSFLSKHKKQALQNAATSLDTSRNFDARARGEMVGQPILFRGNDGRSKRVDRLKSVGNMICPAKAELIGRAILESEAP